MDIDLFWEHRLLLLAQEFIRREIKSIAKLSQRFYARAREHSPNVEVG
jgi:hypothetical protein